MNFETAEQLRSYLKSLPHLNDKGRSARTQKAQEDFYYAVKTYFPHHIDNIVKETSEFRKFVYTNIEDIFATTNKASFEAYRGAAKSTVLTRLYTIWKTAIQNKKRHTVIISSTLDVSKETLDFIKTELEDNERLKADFDIQIGTTFKNTWNEEEIIFKSSNLKFRIKVYGAGKKIRGANWLGFRPDLIICDDIEDDEEFCLRLLKKEKVLLVPGKGFNWNEPDHFRIVYLPRVEELADLGNKIERVLSYYKR